MLAAACIASFMSLGSKNLNFKASLRLLARRRSPPDMQAWVLICEKPGSSSFLVSGIPESSKFDAVLR